MPKESTQTQPKDLSQEAAEIWAVLTAHEKRTMEFGMYPKSLVTEAAQKCECTIEQVIDALQDLARSATRAAA